MPAPAVSIVIATYERLGRLQGCIDAVRVGVRLPHETIVVGGAGCDGTATWAAAQPDIRFIHESRREGATRAYNRGFRAATGRYVMWLNDDARLLAGAVEAAVAMLERPDMADVGMAAYYHRCGAERNRLDSVERGGVEFSIYNVRGVPFANFGLLRRDSLERLGYLDERYYFCAWDPDLSLKVRRQAGLLVLGCREALVDHEELADERKTADRAVAAEDNAKLFAKWRLPERFSYADPGPSYRQFLRERGLAYGAPEHDGVAAACV